MVKLLAAFMKIKKKKKNKVKPGQNPGMDTRKPGRVFPDRVPGFENPGISRPGTRTVKTRVPGRVRVYPARTRFFAIPILDMSAKR